MKTKHSLALPLAILALAVLPLCCASAQLIEARQKVFGMD